MGDLIVFMVTKYGGWAIAAGIVGYFVIEMALDVAGDLVSEAIRDRMDKRAGRIPR